MSEKLDITNKINVTNLIKQVHSCEANKKLV